MIDAQTAATETAKILLEIKAVHFNAAQPFILTSGRASPVYIDCRKIISFPRARRFIVQAAKDMLLRDAGFEQFDCVAGGETAGIPYAAFLSEALDLPMLYVRKKPKGFGRNAQIEGDLKEGARVLLVEDLTTDAGSKVNFVNAVRQAGAVVEHAFVVFHYGIFPRSLETMAGLGVKLHALCTWWDVLRVAREDGRFDPATLAEVEKFLHAPEAWSAANGGTEPA
ncbi:orotate phosphoribosyltransferase [Rhodospirillum centenum]|uniref:Orotate phosphoribosyltransferase n=1 Tax=Rhodospirillum centenum (strain ATCC 51521 / SW) TaxID=414684 RepID=B6IXA1_RHOCS|nr:orotate phosphoribosyltransferase [Rhodospirillum centenum]ACJ00925.1 orotate phosphoribosyltransferase [Rhodospirillum centenum SW]